jgi:hypothetical protein
LVCTFSFLGSTCAYTSAAGTFTTRVLRQDLVTHPPPEGGRGATDPFPVASPRLGFESVQGPEELAVPPNG